MLGSFLVSMSGVLLGEGERETGSEPWIMAVWRADWRVHIWNGLTLRGKRSFEGGKGNVSGTRGESATLLPPEQGWNAE